MNIGTRSTIRDLIKKRRVTKNNILIKSGREKVEPENDIIRLDQKEIIYQKYYYYLMNKPLGVITATKDRRQKTVLDLFNKVDYRKDLFPVGRLDKDTSGLLIITNDGILSHQLLSPNSHAKKVYEALITGKLEEDDINKIRRGIILKDGTSLKPADVKILNFDDSNNTSLIQLTISEGKYHQIRRMIGSLGQRVLKLKRISFAGLKLEDDLLPGTYKILTKDELESLK